MDTKIYYIKRYNTFQINYLCKEIFHEGFLNRTNSKLSEGVDHLEDEVVADSLELVPLQFCLKEYVFWQEFQKQCLGVQPFPWQPSPSWQLYSSVRPFPWPPTSPFQQPYPWQLV